LQELAKVGFWSVDLEDQSVFWSDEVFRIHELEPGDYRPSLKEGLDFYHPDDREKVAQEVERVTQNGGEFHFKLRIISAKENTVTVESFGLARKDKTGSVSRIIGVFRALAE
ncbi:MAG: PAS domain-containing protein, partial [Pseudomonadota bacterium]